MNHAFVRHGNTPPAQINLCTANSLHKPHAAARKAHKRGKEGKRKKGTFELWTVMHCNYCNVTSLGQCKQRPGMKDVVGDSHVAQNLLLLVPVETTFGPRAGSHPAMLGKHTLQRHLKNKHRSVHCIYSWTLRLTQAVLYLAWKKHNHKRQT